MTAQDSFPLAQAEVPSGGNCNDERVQFNANTLLQLIALFFESLLFGAFAVLYFISIWILMYEGHHGRTKLHKWMLAATATTMFVLAITVSG